MYRPASATKSIAVAAFTAVEMLETRTLFAAVTFTVDPALSSLRLSGEVASVLDMEEQHSGSLVAAYNGTIVADVTDTNIAFPGGSNVAALATKSYSPGSTPANYGAKAETGGIFSVKIGEAAIRGLKFDVKSDADIAVSESGAFAAGGIDLESTGGTLNYDLEIGNDGNIDLTDTSANNNLGGNATIRGEGANLTLTIPIDINLSQDSAELRLRGALVANAGTGAPPDPNAVRLGDGSLLKSLAYREADGTVTTVSVKGGGSVDVHFQNATTLTPGKTGSVVISGEGLALQGIDAVGASRKTAISITGKGGADGAAVITSVTADGAVASLGGKGVTLAGLVTVNGRISTLTAATTNGATITADSIGSMKVTGDVAQTTITLDAPFASGTFALGKLAVVGAFSQSRITAAGAIGPVKAATIIRSEIYSAVSSSAARFPATTDLSAEGLIGSVTAKNFADSVIAADTLGKLKLGTVVTDNAGTQFGIAADAFAGLLATNPSKQKLKLTATDEPAALTAALAAQTFDAGDFVIRLG
jgi:hypothetical protein